MICLNDNERFERMLEDSVERCIYKQNGYTSRSHYIECLSEDYNVPLDTVEALADLYGEVEDFDGLVTALQDIEGVFE